MLLDGFIDDWRDHSLIQRGQRPRGFRQYERVVRSFFSWVESRGLQQDPHVIGRDHITEWQRSIFYDSHNLSNRTRASKLSAVRSFFNYLVYSGELPSNPAKGVPSPKIQPKLPQKFSTEELSLIFSAPDISTDRGVRDLAIMKTMYATGARVAELSGLDIGHIHDTGGYIRIDIIDGKGGKSRTITLRTSASRSLRQWMLLRRDIPADHSAVFVAMDRPETNRLSVNAIQLVLKKYTKLVGIDSTNAFCHKMRATFATDLYDSGHDKCPRCGQQIQYIGLPELAILMGHKDIKTTMGYVSISERVLQKIAIPDRRFKEIENFEEQI